jgi:hypothetical protein
MSRKDIDRLMPSNKIEFMNEGDQKSRPSNTPRLKQMHEHVLRILDRAIMGEPSKTNLPKLNLLGA